MGEFVELIENGSDIMFDVAGRHYTILTWPEEGIAIGEQSPNDGELLYYNTAQELVETFKVDGVPLKDLADQIKITEYS